MALAKYRLKGHESFILREGWITKALFAIDRDPLLFTVSAGADALGVGTNMAKSIRYWMRTAGLTDESQATGVHLTELGRTILQCDPYLEDIFTLWIIHINIATNYKLATSWNAGITCQTPAKKYKLYKSSINKSIHFAQRRLSSSTETSSACPRQWIHPQKQTQLRR